MITHAPLSHGHTAATAFLTVYFTSSDYRMSIMTPRRNLWVNQEVLVNCERVMQIYRNPSHQENYRQLVKCRIEPHLGQLYVPSEA
jgi:hypothetical protein